MFSLPLLEIARFRRKLVTRAALVVVIVTPTFYGAAYLVANWNPTDNLDNLTAAVVNADTPAAVSTDGETTTISAGEDLTARLTTGEDAGFSWTEATAGQAEDGLEKGRYAAVLTVPASFSASLASLAGDSPKAAALSIQTNDAYNYINGNIAQALLASVSDRLSATTIAAYLDSIYIGFNELHSSVSSAADGARVLAEGSAALDAGLGGLVTGVGELDAGAAQLQQGASTLAAGTASSATGAATLSAGARQVAAGTARVAASTNDVVTRVASAQAALDGALGQARPRADTVAGQLATSRDLVQTSLSSQVATLAARYPDDPDVAALGRSLTEANAVLTPAAATAGTVATEIASTDAAVRDNAAQASASARNIATEIAALNAGAQRVASGAAALSGGLRELSTGAADVAAGATALRTGTESALAGTSRAKVGSAALAAGAGVLAQSLVAGAERVPTFSSLDRDIRTKVISAPVEAKATRANAVAAYGDGIAPYFIPIALWIGGLITYQVLRAVPPRAFASPARSWRIAVAGYVPGVLFALVQGVLLSVVLKFVVGVSAPNFSALLGLISLTAVAFAAMHQALVAWFGGIGRLLALILLVFMLTSGGGAYAVQTAPPFFQAISPFFPLTYVVGGLRTLIAGGDPAAAWTAVGVLCLTIGASLLVTVLAAHQKRTWTIARLHPSITF
ncbi:putative membrane protein [Glaciihabitans tibetensis]|uniref:Putative membrane protein n=1 Tax=Glaciihabitans tibetensis TaxID=1266600 RepID=A0A2T0VGF5_9MICO|nr:YhgE/Pip domain-containing protein [Glaciihabitans tibetensis]PRY69144.1 putative membrane protein [Glaciihabitans tibetensis]